MRRRSLAVLGGTFDHLHRGHEALLATAFRIGDDVAIGMTTDRFLDRHRKPSADRLESYAVRARRLRRWLARSFPGRSWRTVPLEDRFGGSVEPGVTVLVVSADTVAGGRAVNDERRRRGVAPVPMVIVPLVLADDLLPISSRRIRAGEIDRHGRRRSPITIGISVQDPADRAPVVRGVRAAFPRARISPSRFPDRGAAIARLRRAARVAARGREIGISVARHGPREALVVLAKGPLVLEPRSIGPDLFRGVRDATRPPLGRKGFGQ